MGRSLGGEDSCGRDDLIFSTVIGPRAALARTLTTNKTFIK